MFSIVLKNTILMILLILIIHFIIINYIADLKRVVLSTQNLVYLPEKKDTSPKPVEHNKRNEAEVSADDPSSNHLGTILEEDATVPTRAEEDKKDSLQDLYDFVYNDTMTDSSAKQLNALFAEDESLPNAHLTVPCEDQPVDSDKVEMCKNEVDQFYEKNKKEVMSSNVQTSTTKEGHPILYEYKDEVQALDGYESFTSSFMQL
jgi:hypothetical protein